MCFGNCGEKKAVSQCLLSPEKYIAHWEAVGQSLYLYLEVGLESQMAQFGGKGVGERDCE